MDGQRCDSCRFWSPCDVYHGYRFVGKYRPGEPLPYSPDQAVVGNGNYIHGGCQRYPLHVFRTASGDYEYQSSMSPDHHWCGEYAPANPETVSEAAATLARFVLMGDKSAAYALIDKLTEGRTG